MAKRGTFLDTGNRFITRTSEPFDDGWDPDEEEEGPQTEYITDVTKRAFSTNKSPDIPFTHSINPYRGCEHGCAYCYARPSHEYYGFNAGIDFETKIVVKYDAAKLAREEMMKKSWKPTVVSISGNTDPYQPAERRFGITRSVLEVMLDFRNPVGIITKNGLVMRDVDILSEMAQHNCVTVFLSITTLDRDLARRMEPRTASPERRLKAVETLAKAGVPVGVMTAPIIPGLNDTEIPQLLKAASEAGAYRAGFTILRVPLAIKPIFLDWLEREEPGRVAKVKHALEGMRGGQMNLSQFGKRMSGEGPRADAIKNMFAIHANKYGLNKKRSQITTENFRRPGEKVQLGLFG